MVANLTGGGPQWLVVCMLSSVSLALSQLDIFLVHDSGVMFFSSSGLMASGVILPRSIGLEFDPPFFSVVCPGLHDLGKLIVSCFLFCAQLL